MPTVSLHASLVEGLAPFAKGTLVKGLSPGTPPLCNSPLGLTNFWPRGCCLQNPSRLPLWALELLCPLKLPVPPNRGLINAIKGPCLQSGSLLALCLLQGVFGDLARASACQPTFMAGLSALLGVLPDGNALGTLATRKATDTAQHDVLLHAKGLVDVAVEIVADLLQVAMQQAWGHQGPGRGIHSHFHL